VTPIYVKKYKEDQKAHLKTFCDQMVKDGFPPWSFDRLKLNKTTYFCAYYENKIVAINGVRNIKDNIWCPMVRQGTLKSHLGLLKSNRVWGSGSIQPRFLAKPSIEYCLSQGADKLVAYINTDGKDTNLRYGKKADRMIKMGLWEYDGMYKINGTMQDLFVMNIDNFLKFISIVEKQPLVLRETNES
jgi:hypothetical protein